MKLQRLNDQMMPQTSPKIGFQILLGVIFFLGILIYSNTWRVPFLFDDSRNITQNLSLHKATDIPKIWSSNTKTRFLPYLSFAINYSLGKNHVWGYHFFNLAIHILNSIWVYFLISLLLTTPKMKGKYPDDISQYLSACVALIFLSHPLQTQSVTYIVQRMTSMVAFFYLGAVVLYLKSRISQDKICYGLSLGMTVAAMFCKENAFTIPLMLLLIEFLFFDFAKKNLTPLIPFLATLLIIPYLIHSDTTRQDIQSGIFLPIQQKTLSRTDYLLTQAQVLCSYLRLFLFPVNQNIDYDYPATHSLLDPKTLACFIFLASLFMLAFWMLKKNRLAAFAVFWFFLTLSVESSIFPLDDVIFEHRMYLPLMGCALLLALGLFSFLGKLSHGLIAGALILLTFSCMAYARNQVWRSELVLWEDTIKKSPNKARPYNNLGNCYYEIPNLKKARGFFERAVALDPYYGEAYYNLGRTYEQEGNPEKALEFYLKSTETRGERLEAYVNAGVLYKNRGESEKAIALLEKAIRKFPSALFAYLNLSSYYAEKGNSERAVYYLEKAIALDPYFAPSYYRLGKIFGGTGQWDKAIELFRKACALNPQDAYFLYALGEAYFQKGDRQTAVEIARLLQKTGKTDLAKKLADSIEQKNPAFITPS